MKKITRRAVSVLLLAALVIVGLTVYVLRYIDHGADWALYFNRLNSGSSGELLDRNGVVLASFSANENLYASDALHAIQTDGAQFNYGYREGYFEDIIASIVFE